MPVINWRDISAFYKILCQTTAITQLALPLLILTEVRTYPLRYICEDQVKGDIWITAHAKQNIPTKYTCFSYLNTYSKEIFAQSTSHLLHDGSMNDAILPPPYHIKSIDHPHLYAYGVIS